MLKNKNPKEMFELNNKRKELILKILGQLYKGQVGNIAFKKGLIYKINYYEDYNKQQKKEFDIYTDFNGLREELLKNIHDIAKKLNNESLSILEFLMDKMIVSWKPNIALKEIKTSLFFFNPRLFIDCLVIKAKILKPQSNLTLYSKPHGSI